MGCLWCVNNDLLFVFSQRFCFCDDAKAMLHLQLDAALMNGARQEHYMFDPDSPGRNHLLWKVSVCELPVVMEIQSKSESGTSLE